MKSSEVVAAPFAPLRVLRYVPGDGRPVFLSAAVLLADLANFTGLTEALATRVGGDGGEFVSRSLNQVLTRAVDAIAMHGGEVIKFSGDGLLCMFLGHGGAAEAAQRAAQEIAAAAIEGPSGEIHRFRSAIVQGVVTLAQIGGHGGRHELVAGGEAVEAAQQLVLTATPGEVGPFVALSMVTLASPPQELEPLLEPASFLPAYVRDRLSADLEQWLQEMRTLTIVFSATELAPDLATMQATALAIQVVADAQGGQLLRFSLERQWLVAEIAFGLVVGVAATSPREAMQCGILLAREVPGTRIGISTGRVLLGPIGSTTRRQLTTLGSAVNIAARLMQHADAGQVLADDATWDPDGGTLQGSRSQATLKGLGERSFWRVTPSDALSRAPDEGFFGRSIEVEAVRDALAEPLAPLRPIVIQGEAGIGKSRFARWLADELRGRDIVTRTATATPVGRDTPYAALATVIADLCELTPGIDSARRLAEVSQRLLGDADRAPLIGDALRLSLPETASTTALAGAARADNIRSALSALFAERASRGAFALILDDAHWLDSSSWTLLQRLATEVGTLRLVIVTRPMLSLEPPPLQSIRARNALVLELEPLSPSHITSVMERRMAAGDVPLGVADWVIERARGNPFFAQELASMLIAVGKVEVRAGTFVRVPDASELDALPLATTIERTLEQRIERLGVRDAGALKVASVLGLTFSLDALGELASHSGDVGIAEVVSRLVAADLAVPAGVGRFAFRHRFTQEAAYRMLPSDKRRDLHRHVAQGVERRFGDRAEERAGELAHHWFAAEDRPRATHWLDRAGRQALHSGADREASTHFRRALSIGDGQPPGRLASWHRQLARALLGLGQVEKVALEARHALELVGRPLPTKPLGWVGLSLRTILLRTLRSLPSWQTRARTRPLESEDLLEGARAAGLLAESAYFVNAPEMMVGSALLAVELAERAENAAPVSVAHGMLGVVAGMARLHGTALRHLARARALSETAGDPLQQGIAWFYAGLYYGCIGDWDASLDAEQRALSFTEQLGAHGQSGFQLTLIATNALYTSEYAQTRACMATVGERAERAANIQQQGFTYNVLSVADLHQSRYEDAIERSARGREIFLVERDRISLIVSEGVHCAALWRAGRWTEALTCADRASIVIDGARPTTWGQLEGFAGPCEVYAAAAEKGLLTHVEARRRARVALTGLRLFALVFPFGRARYHWIRGLFEVARGHRAAARRCFRRSITVARRFRMPFEEMHAAELLASQVEQDERTRLQARCRALRELIEQAAPTLQPEVQAV